MAACKTCGGKAGAFKDECKNCETSRLANERAVQEERDRAQAQRQAEDRAQASRELESRTVAFIEKSIDSFRRTLNQGRTPYLYSLIGVSVPYTLLEQEGGALPDLHDLAALGRDGWEIVATLPQTAGIGLTNVYQKGGGKTWAGGIGGIVTGVFLLIRLPISAETLNQESSMIRAALRAGYQDARSAVSQEVVIPGVASGTERSGISPLASMALGAAGMAIVADAAMDMGIVGDGGGFDGGDGGGDFDGGGFDI